MEKYKQEFIEFMVRSEVLRFGDFITKSGRRSPFFINTGNYRTGEQMNRLCGFYAEAVVEHFGQSFDVLFGPAYKGIPLVVGTAMILASRYNHNVAFCFNRKEIKDHGEGGALIGYTLKEDDKVLIVEDVITAGTSIRHSISFLNTFVPIKLQGLIVSVDRQERGNGHVSALEEMRNEFEIKAVAIVTLDEIVEYLYKKEIDGVVVITEETKKKIDEYRKTYGVFYQDYS